MKRLFLIPALMVLVVLLASCSTMPTPVNQPVLLGMTQDDLRTTFGPPLRTVHHADGSEDWFYNFGTQTQGSRPVSEVTETARERSVTYGTESSTSVTYREAPIQLSPTGRVIGTIPVGQVIRK